MHKLPSIEDLPYCFFFVICCLISFYDKMELSRILIPNFTQTLVDILETYRVNIKTVSSQILFKFS